MDLFEVKNLWKLLKEIKILLCPYFQVKIQVNTNIICGKSMDLLVD